MLMTLRSNGIFPDQQNPQSIDHYTASQLAETVVQYTNESSLRSSSANRSNGQYSPSSASFATAQRSRAAVTRRSPPLMNGLLGNAPQPQMYVRALYDYEADDR